MPFDYGFSAAQQVRCLAARHSARRGLCEASNPEPDLRAELLLKIYPMMRSRDVPPINNAG